MKNKIVIEGEEFELPESLINEIKERLNKNEKLNYTQIEAKVGVKFFNTSLIITSEKHSKKLEAINKLMNVAKYLNGDWKHDMHFDVYADWKYTFEIVNHSKLVIANHLYIKSIVYFKTEELARQALEILGEDVIRTALSTDW